MASGALQRPAWIGEQPTATQLAANLAVGVTGILIAGLQPLLLGVLAQEGRITTAQIGEAATAELLMMGAASAYAGARWNADRLRLIGVVAALMLGAIDVLTGRFSGGTITLLRALAGIPSGILIWITVAMIARTPLPERWSGFYLTTQTLVQFLIAASLTAWVVPAHGARGGFVALGMLAFAAAFIAPFMPNRFAPLIEDGAKSNVPPARGWLALSACFLYQACIVAVWVYAEPLSHQRDHAASAAGTAVAVSLACQVMGGSAATILAPRLKWFPTVLICSVLNAGCIASFLSLTGASSFVVTSGAFGFLWLFVLPFLVPMVISADPTRRAAVLVGGAQLLGGSLGPLMASMIVTESDVRGAFHFGWGALAFSVLVMIALCVPRRAIRHVAEES